MVKLNKIKWSRVISFGFDGMRFLKRHILTLTKKKNRRMCLLKRRVLTVKEKNKVVVADIGGNNSVPYPGDFGGCLITDGST